MAEWWAFAVRIEWDWRATAALLVCAGVGYLVIRDRHRETQRRNDDD